METQTKLKFIIDTSKPFRGWTQSIILDDGTVAYTDGLTFEEYQEKKGDHYKAISEAELHELIDKYERELQKPWQEISSEEYWDAYECLPPIYNSPFWFISEATYGNLHSCFIEINDKYYTALRPITMGTKELFTELINDIKN